MATSSTGLAVTPSPACGRGVVERADPLHFAAPRIEIGRERRGARVRRDPQLVALRSARAAPDRSRPAGPAAPAAVPRCSAGAFCAWRRIRRHRSGSGRQRSRQLVVITCSSRLPAGGPARTECSAISRAVLRRDRAWRKRGCAAPRACACCRSQAACAGRDTWRSRCESLSGSSSEVSSTCRPGAPTALVSRGAEGDAQNDERVQQPRQEQRGQQAIPHRRDAFAQ